MKKAILTFDLTKKINFVNSLDKKALIVIPTSKKDILEKIKIPHEYILLEELNKAIHFLNFQSKVNNGSVLVIFDALRYSEFNNTKYNKIYTLSRSAQNCIVIDSYPFVFDSRNIFVIQYILGVETYHHKQFYDNNFVINLDGNVVSANSLEAIYNNLYEYIYTDIKPFNYVIHEWLQTDVELDQYNKFKHKLIYETKKNGKDLTKVNIVTWLQGTSNRFDSKLKCLQSVLSEIECKTPTIFYNWDKGIRKHNSLIKHDVNMVSYHQETADNNCDVLFFETIISQKIKFYEKLAQYSNSKLHFFINPQLGADKKVVNETIDIVKSLNQFCQFEWKKI